MVTVTVDRRGGGVFSPLPLIKYKPKSENISQNGKKQIFFWFLGMAEFCQRRKLLCTACRWKRQEDPRMAVDRYAVKKSCKKSNLLMTVHE